MREFVGYVLSSLAAIGLVLVPAAVGSPGLPDLPSAGRSAFDHFLSQDALPFPFKNLVEKLRGAGGKPIASVIIPNGRSLARFVTDPAAPRVVVTGQAPDPSLRIPDAKSFFQALNSEKIFIGYSEKAQALEVISYNETARRYEFQLVTNYGPGLQPKVEYAPRSLCLSCHQNGGPIFSERRWEETDHVEEVLNQLQKNMKDDYGLRPSGFVPGSSGALDVDAQVQEAGRLVQFQEIWDGACRGPQAAACRKAILKASFAQQLLRPQEAKIYTDQLETALKELWPKGGFAISSFQIPSRDPQAFPAGKPLPPELDPLTIRPKILLHHPADAAPSFRETASFSADIGKSFLSNRELNFLVEHSGGSPETFWKALDSPAIAKVLQGEFPGPRQFQKALANELGIADPTPTLLVIEKAMPAPRLAGSEMAAAADPRFPTLAYFKRNCAACHSGAGNSPMNFMAEKDDAKLWANLLHNPKVLSRISWENLPEEERMPPAASAQGKRLRAEGGLERIQMLNAIQEGRSAAEPGCSPLFKNLSGVP